MTYVLLGLMGAGTAVGIVRILLLWHFRRRGTTLSAEAPKGDRHPTSRCLSPLPRVSIIVPAKDEGANIAACVQSLLAQDYPNFEIIVVDDRSEDRTAAFVAGLAARDSRLRLLRNTELPDGWTGKCRALAMGAERADGEWLLFTDADTTHAPVGLRAAVTLATSRQMDLLTLLPAVAAGSVWEGALHPCLAALLLSLFPPSMVGGSRRWLAFANGQYILIRRAAYDRLGGHAAVRGEFLEDIALARLARRAGMRLTVAHGGSVLRTRMYRGLRALWQGWSRIFYGSGRSTLVLVLSMVLALVGTLLPLGVVLGSIAAVALGRMPGTLWAPLVLALVQIGTAFLCMGIFYRMGGFRLRSLPLHPLAAAVTVGILGNAVRLRWFARQVTWRGTTYRRGAAKAVAET